MTLEYRTLETMAAIDELVNDPLASNEEKLAWLLSMRTHIDMYAEALSVEIDLYE